MNNRIILIDHHENLRDDLLTTILSERGFNIDLRCPFKGDELPRIGDDIVGAAIYGGAQNVTELDDHPFLESEIEWINHAISQKIPLLGICLGAQLLAHTLGAKVENHPDGLCEFGYYPISPTAAGETWFPKSMNVTQAHLQRFELPEGAELLAKGGKEFPNQAFRFGDNVFGLQFHPEVTSKIFKRWQDSDWAFYDVPGAQDRDTQNQLIVNADSIQGDWFFNFLNQLYPSTLYA